MVEAQHRHLERMLNAVEEFRKIDPEFPSQTIATFLTVAIEPEITVKDLEGKLGLARGSASRNAALLSTRPARRPGREKPGYGLIEYQENPLDLRVKELRLTKKGYTLMQAINDILKGVSVLLLTAATTTGCGVTLDRSEWKHPQADMRWDKDSYECEMEARSIAGTGGRETFGLAQQLADKCMAARGWKK